MADVLVTHAVLQEELPVLEAWSRRSPSRRLSVDLSQLRLDVFVTQHSSGLEFQLRGRVDGYKGLPPAWNFVVPGTDIEGAREAFPKSPAATPGGGSPIFIEANGRPVICLPCNRLAFQTEGGPHGNWVLATWMEVEPRYLTLAEMVSRINTELQASNDTWLPRIKAV